MCAEVQFQKFLFQTVSQLLTMVELFGLENERHKCKCQTVRCFGQMFSDFHQIRKNFASSLPASFEFGHGLVKCLLHLVGVVRKRAMRGVSCFVVVLTLIRITYNALGHIDFSHAAIGNLRVTFPKIRVVLASQGSVCRRDDDLLCVWHHTEACVVVF